MNFSKRKCFYFFSFISFYFPFLFSFLFFFLPFCPSLYFLSCTSTVCSHGPRRHLSSSSMAASWSFSLLNIGSLIFAFRYCLSALNLINGVSLDLLSVLSGHGSVAELQLVFNEIWCSKQNPLNGY